MSAAGTFADCVGFGEYFSSRVTSGRRLQDRVLPSVTPCGHRRLAPITARPDNFKSVQRPEFDTILS